MQTRTNPKGQSNLQRIKRLFPPPTFKFPNFASHLPYHNIIHIIAPSNQVEPNEHQLGQILATPQTKPRRYHITKPCPNTALEVLVLFCLSSLVSPFVFQHPLYTQASLLFLLPILKIPFHQSLLFHDSVPLPWAPPSSHLCPVCAITLAVANVS